LQGRSVIEYLRDACCVMRVVVIWNAFRLHR
jgi:hypothetical protein